MFSQKTAFVTLTFLAGRTGWRHGKCRGVGVFRRAYGGVGRQMCTFFGGLVPHVAAAMLQNFVAALFTIYGRSRSYNNGSSLFHVNMWPPKHAPTETLIKSTYLFDSRIHTFFGVSWFEQNLGVVFSFRNDVAGLNRLTQFVVTTSWSKRSLLPVLA